MLRAVILNYLNYGRVALNSLIGTWQMIHTECRDHDGNFLAAPYGPDGMGILSLSADGRLICVLCESGKEPVDGKTREYNSYCGSYQFDGEQLITRVDACSNPEWIGSDQIRDVSFENNVLVLRPVKGSGPQSPGQRVLHWVKLTAPSDMAELKASRL